MAKVIKRLGTLYSVSQIPGSPCALVYEVSPDNVILAGPYYVPKWACS